MKKVLAIAAYDEATKTIEVSPYGRFFDLSQPLPEAVVEAGARAMYEEGATRMVKWPELPTATADWWREKMRIAGPRMLAKLMEGTDAG